MRYRATRASGVNSYVVRRGFPTLSQYIWRLQHRVGARLVKKASKGGNITFKNLGGRQEKRWTTNRVLMLQRSALNTAMASHVMPGIECMFNGMVKGTSQQFQGLLKLGVVDGSHAAGGDAGLSDGHVRYYTTRYSVDVARAYRAYLCRGHEYPSCRVLLKHTTIYTLGIH